MAQFPYLPLFTDAWKADTDHLSGPIGRQKRCLYMDLLIEMWRRPGCRVPNDDAWLMQHLHITADEVRELLRPVIVEFCQSDGHWLTQKRLKKEFVFAFERAGRLSSLAKRRKNKANGANGSRSAAAVGQPIPIPHKQEPSPGESQQPPPVEKQEVAEQASDEQASEPPQTLADINRRWRGPFT